MTDRLFYTAGEMAAKCGIHDRTWRKWVSSGYAPQPVYVGPAPRWRACDIEKWMKDLKRDACPVRRAAKDRSAE